MGEFVEGQVAEVREQITEVVENVEIFNALPVAGVPEALPVVQENITEVQEDITIVQMSLVPDGSKPAAGAGEKSGRS